MLMIFLATVATIGYFWYRKISRRAKDIERSLKMVPLLLKLPPQETDEGNRDLRELMKENIAKAEGVFNLLSGVATEKSNFYGKKHIVITDGKEIEIEVNDAYLISSILDPGKDIVKGFNKGMMQPYRDKLSDAQITLIIDYLKTLTGK